MTLITKADYFDIFDAIPGGESVLPLILDDVTQGIDWPDYQALIRQVPIPPVPYIPNGVFDCDKFTRWGAAHVNAIWAKSGADVPLAHGIINGDVPQDGDNRVTGFHSLGWFLDTKRELYLVGWQDREIMSRERVKEIKDVDSIIVG